MCWDNYQLTEKQRSFAEEHHGLLLKYLSSNQLGEEYYSVLVERYLKTVVKYLESRDLQRYKFSTILWKNLRSELSNYWRAERNQSLTIALDEDYPMYEVEAPMSEVLWERIEEVLTRKQMDTILLRNQGFSNREIGSICHISEKAVEKRFARIRKIMRQKDLELL